MISNGVLETLDIILLTTVLTSAGTVLIKFKAVHNWLHKDISKDILELKKDVLKLQCSQRGCCL